MTQKVEVVSKRLKMFGRVRAELTVFWGWMLRWWSTTADWDPSWSLSTASCWWLRPARPWTRPDETVRTDQVSASPWSGYDSPAYLNVDRDTFTQSIIRIRINEFRSTVTVVSQHVCAGAGGIASPWILACLGIFFQNTKSGAKNPHFWGNLEAKLELEHPQSPLSEMCTFLSPRRRRCIVINYKVTWQFDIEMSVTQSLCGRGSICPVFRWRRNILLMCRFLRVLWRAVPDRRCGY